MASPRLTRDDRFESIDGVLGGHRNLQITTGRARSSRLPSPRSDLGSAPITVFVQARLYD